MALDGSKIRALSVSPRRHDTQHNDILHNNKLKVIPSIVVMLCVANKPFMLSVVMLNVVALNDIMLSVQIMSLWSVSQIKHYVECQYAECHYVECHYPHCF
jgi:hypothetical protein